MPFSQRGIEQSLVLPPRWPLILYTGTLYAFNQGFTSIVVLCYHAEIIASGLGWPDPILLHCTHQKQDKD